MKITNYLNKPYSRNCISTFSNTSNLNVNLQGSLDYQLNKQIKNKRKKVELKQIYKIDQIDTNELDDFNPIKT